MEILSSSDATTFKSETLSANGTSECDSTVHQDDSHVGGTRETREDSSSTHGGSTSDVASSAHNFHVSLGTETSQATSMSDVENVDLPETEFIRHCYQAIQQNNLKKMDPPELESTSGDVAKFCGNCIRNLQLKNDMGTPRSEGDGGRAGNSKADLKVPVRPVVFERLKFERLLHSMREVIQLPEDDRLKDCQICRNVKTATDERTFIKENVRHLKNRLTEERLQKHLIEMDSVNCIGRLAADLPRNSDPPEVIWKKLLER